MAVLVQEIINVNYAFVVHTTNPSSEDSTEIYAEVVKGLGETLVGAYSGRGAGLYDSVPTDEEEKVVLDYSTDPLIVDSKFQHSILSNIAKAGHAIKELYGSPQDIDGIVKDGWGTNEKLIISILAHRNVAQCNLICKTYAETYGEDLLKSLEKELSSDFELNATLNHYNNKFGTAITKDLKYESEDDFLGTVRATINCLTCPNKYFEKVLRLGINNQGTDEWALTRVVTTRVEVDLKKIKDEYFKRNNVPLDRAIGKYTSEDYEEMLPALVGKDFV
ncbi:hypothetical protein GIB67_014808 [Kingdonia uniflora]|uniref:Annexin n=1 Tax=Kingdonia uniflora TaxID=39325 RepID=A0A7J7NUX1_9MAGN|nr:hypothetical protein GIB67_014808 [Kingdonia uniflora]